METLLEIFMRRDGLSKDEAEAVIDGMKEDVLNGADPEQVLYEEGLEPDFIFEILP